MTDIPHNPLGLVLNLPLELEGGRLVLIRSGSGKTMVCRQKAGPPLKLGDTVRTIPGRDGRRAVLLVTKGTKKDVTFQILGAETGAVAWVRGRWYAFKRWLQRKVKRAAVQTTVGAGANQGDRREDSSADGAGD